ncbi:LacI family DNA-binding transcriptional regulator [Rhodoferax saidenbachensis]|uniref:LacI family transcriptional regulator n=1 Tax=Rhodoferax saidenbachensis TaxID=1484693 RepID=A0ABU1ZJQ0_9BURK|nr:LacI family DNA-binding transcriptional regulator [Rhodoferax saidenbachensis]MDR7305774.1 LacI family transcriptional regulator [Rhodoferax saidenbachensis]
MTNPTMQDVARLAGVGVATVDRVINGRAAVRPATSQRVLQAAKDLGFHRSGLIERRVQQEARTVRLGFLLQSQASPFYRALGQALRQQVLSRRPAVGTPVIEFMEEFTPRHVAERLNAVAAVVDAVALVAADHPVINHAVEQVRGLGVPVFTLVTDLTSTTRSGYVGVDNRKMGRMAAWSVAQLCPQPGKVGLLLGSHRYVCQEECEASFRSYLREYAPQFQVLETLVSLEDVELARKATLELLLCHPDLVGVYVAGGGIEGVLDALREAAIPGLITVCHDLTDITRRALLEGQATVVLSHPREAMAQRLVDRMVGAVAGERPLGLAALPFHTYTAANV